MEARDDILKSGVVTFLDILGWKGVYSRKTDAIRSLTLLIEGAKKEALKRSRGRSTESVEIKSISDTIAIFTFASDKEISDVIDVHGEVCHWLLQKAIEAELPLRGAIACGEFQISDNIFVGKAIDEAAAWHEQSDWIGVHLTPSAEFIFIPSPKSQQWLVYQPPFKNRLQWKTHCVNWTSKWEDRATEIESVKSKFLRLGPIIPEIAGKFTNTLGFADEANSVGRSQHSQPDSELIIDEEFHAAP